MIQENLETFVGKRVVDFDPEEGIAAPREVVYRIRTEYDGPEIGELLGELLADPRVGEIPALVIGLFASDVDTDSQEVVRLLTSHRDRLPNLRALFLGDITSEEQEISWIQQSDLSPLWRAFPQLEHLQVRGGEHLDLGSVRHDHLRVLILESGGLPATVVRQVARAELPRLEHLELWLGTDNYGGDSTIQDLAPILADRFPALRTLGLRDSEHADQIAIEVAASPVLDRIEVLDLSLGTLSDVGAAALLASPRVARLKKLDLHHHYVSPDMIASFHRLGIGRSTPATRSSRTRTMIATWPSPNDLRRVAPIAPMPMLVLGNPGTRGWTSCRRRCGRGICRRPG